MSQSADDLAAVFADASLTVPVVFGAQATRGILTITDESLSTGEGADVVGELTTCEIVTGSLTGLRLNQRLTVNGAKYSVQDTRRIEDGAITRLYLVPLTTNGEA